MRPLGAAAWSCLRQRPHVERREKRSPQRHQGTKRSAAAVSRRERRETTNDRSPRAQNAGGPGRRGRLSGGDRGSASGARGEVCGVRLPTTTGHRPPKPLPDPIPTLGVEFPWGKRGEERGAERRRDIGLAAQPSEVRARVRARVRLGLAHERDSPPRTLRTQRGTLTTKAPRHEGKRRTTVHHEDTKGTKRSETPSCCPPWLCGRCRRQLQAAASSGRALW